MTMVGHMPTGVCIFHLMAEYPTYQFNIGDHINQVEYEEA